MAVTGGGGGGGGGVLAKMSEGGGAGRALAAPWKEVRGVQLRVVLVEEVVLWSDTGDESMEFGKELEKELLAEEKAEFGGDAEVGVVTVVAALRGLCRWFILLGQKLATYTTSKSNFFAMRAASQATTALDARAGEMGAGLRMAEAKDWGRALGGRTGGGGARLDGGFDGCSILISARSSSVRARKSSTGGSWTTVFFAGLALSRGSCTYESLQSSSSKGTLEAVIRLDGGADAVSLLIALLEVDSLNRESRRWIISGEGSGVSWVKAVVALRPRSGGEGNLNSS